MLLDEEKEWLAAVHAADKRIADMKVHTPLMESKWLSLENNCNVFMKLESEQVTGSFKLRGAANKLRLLLEHSKDRFSKESLVTASSGNHALGCAYMSMKLNAKMTIYSYEGMPRSKEEKILMYPNVELKKYGTDCGQAEGYARYQSEKNGLIYISPYNDIDVLQGNATVALEMFKQNKDLDVIFVPVGGGGLISGISKYMKLVKPSIHIVACQPVNDCCMYESIKAGYIVENTVLKSTLSDGTAGNVEPGSITFGIIKQYVDEWVLLEEEEIELAVYDMLVTHSKLIEGAAALTIAGVRKLKSKLRNKNVALVICGSNLGVVTLENILRKYGGECSNC